MAACAFDAIIDPMIGNRSESGLCKQNALTASAFA
jgi:hypothetical protein